MTYHDALINQLSGLVRKVEQLRGCLQETDKNVFKVSLQKGDKTVFKVSLQEIDKNVFEVKTKQN